MSIHSSSLSPSQWVSDIYAPSTQHPRLNESKKSPYQVVQQVKFLHLLAEVESLLQHLQFLKQQKIATANFDAPDK